MTRLPGVLIDNCPFWLTRISVPRGMIMVGKFAWSAAPLIALSLHTFILMPTGVRIWCPCALREWAPDPSAASRPQDKLTASVQSEEHTSELQSPCNLVCRLLPDK